MLLLLLLPAWQVRTLGWRVAHQLSCKRGLPRLLAHGQQQLQPPAELVQGQDGRSQHVPVKGKALRHALPPGSCSLQPGSCLRLPLLAAGLQVTVLRMVLVSLHMPGTAHKAA